MPEVLDARMPPALRALHALFSSLEFSLSSLALYQHTSDWDTVKRAIETSSQSTFTKEHLQQILWLLPRAYDISWSRPSTRKRSRASNDDHDDRDPEEIVLLIRRKRLSPDSDSSESKSEIATNDTIAANETLADRIDAFTRRLNAFIDEEDAKGVALDAIDVGKVALPEKDVASAQQQAKQRLDAVAKKNALAVTSKELQEALAKPVPEDLQTLPKWLIDKVRRQEQQSNKVSQRSDEAQKQRLYTTLPQLSDQIQSLTLVQRKHVFLLPELARSLLTKAPIRDQIQEQIHLLESMVPFWITVFYSDGKEYVKLSKSHKYNEVKTALRKAISTML